MEKELSLEKLFSDIILFFIRNKYLITSITIGGILSVILFQKLKPAFFKTNAIATSGIAAYERFEDDDILNQRTAINMINNLQLDVRKEDYDALSKKLNISLEESSGIKYIEAEQIFREDKDEKKHNTPKFQIDLLVRNNALITIVQDGLISYFNNNDYIKTYQRIYNETNNDIINTIDEEIKELRSLRNTQNSTIDFSTNTILSSRDEMDIQNQIVDLKHKKSIIITNNEMLKPITFVEDFSLTTIEEREVIVWGSAIGFLSFILSIIISIILELKQKAIKQEN
tara:strand:- start:9984 stop:10838 length:855 start_codon:yes stop_codon:yes gene_type:complete